MDAGVSPTIPAFSTVMACSTSMIGAIEAAGMLNGVNRNLALVGGVESMSRVQLGLGQSLSDWLRKFQQARSLGQKVSHVSDLKPRRHQALYSRRDQSHDGNEHGRAHRDHSQGVECRP